MGPTVLGGTLDHTHARTFINHHRSAEVEAQVRRMLKITEMTIKVIMSLIL